MDKYFDASLIGIAVGGSYALIGISLTLMFRTTGVLSFAHAAFAMLAGFVFAELAGKHGWPTLLAALAALLVAVSAALATERLAMRRLTNAGPAVKLIATLGVLSIVTGLVTEWFGSQPYEPPLVFPAGVFRIGNAGIAYQQLGLLGITLLMAVLLRAFLLRTSFGVAVRAAEANPEAAELLGISTNRIAQFNWALGGALSAFVGILLTPLIAATVASYPLVLVKALTGTLFGGLSSLPLTLAGGLAVGVIESVTRVASGSRGAPELAVMVAVPVLLVLRRSWSNVPSGAVTTRAQPAGRGRLLVRRAVARHPAVGTGTRAVVLGALAIVVVVGSMVAAGSEYWGSVGCLALFFAIEALSMVVLTGWGGQVSLMHGAYVGIGTFITGWLVGVHGLPLEAALPLAGLVGVGVGAILGVPALRLDGVQFAIASTVFAAAAVAWLFELPDLPRNMNRGRLLSVDLFDSGNLFVVMLAVAAVFFVAVGALRRSTWWCLLIAARDVPSAVRHAGLHPGVIRMVAFCVASFIATIGGALFGILATSYSPFNFSLMLSFSLLLYAVVGGLESLLGPVIAALAFGVLPQVIQQQSTATGSSWPAILAGVVVIGLLALQPRGLAASLSGLAPAPRTIAFGRFDVAVDGAATPAVDGNGSVSPTTDAVLPDHISPRLR